MSNVNDMKMPSSSIMNIMSLADEVTAEVFAFLGALDTARCSKICRRWNLVAKQSRALWRCFVYDDFGLDEGAESADWKAVYAYIKSQEHAYYESVGDCFIQSRLVFCDDGSHQPGNNPEHALQRNGDVCWCTNAFVDHDVDLVADLTAPHLVMAFTVGNGGLRFSAPVKEAIAFASLKMPDLEAAHAYDGSEGIRLAHEMVVRENNERHNKWRGRRLPPGHPLAGFVFPGIPQAFDAVCSQPSLRPTVARFVHFKLLTSSKCFNRVSNNIDVCNLFTFGVPLPELSAMIHKEVENILPDPSRYARRHQVREYPWHLHEAFQQQELEVAMQDHLMRHQRALREQLERHHREMEEVFSMHRRQMQEHVARTERAMHEHLIRTREQQRVVRENMEGLLQPFPPHNPARIASLREHMVLHNENMLDRLDANSQRLQEQRRSIRENNDGRLRAAAVAAGIINEFVEQEENDSADDEFGDY